MKYYRQARHYYQVREHNVLHVNQGDNIINLLSLDEFIFAANCLFLHSEELLIESEELEFFTALDVVLMCLELPVK